MPHRHHLSLPKRAFIVFLSINSREIDVQSVNRMLPMKPIQAKALKSMITEQKPPLPGPSLVNIKLQPFAKRRSSLIYASL